jgi:predicted O-methyltransferase YrrM
MRVLEFGCGASTIYLSKKVSELLSFENYPDWAVKTRAKIENEKVKILDVKDITDYNSNDELIYGEFDILIIDNLGNRMQCAVHNLKHLKDNGVVVWDNTDGPDWDIIKSFMESQNFKEISFTGMVAQELSLSRTTLFYRANNCLNI